MGAFTLEQHSIHHINLDAKSLIKATTPPLDGSKSNDIKAYSEQALREILESSRGQSFRFSSSTEEVASLSAKIMSGDWDDSSQKIAERLLRTEINTQEELGKFQDVKKGSLLQMKLSDGQRKFLIFTKVDHGRILDEKDSSIHFGLPFEKKAQKTCVVEYGQDLSPISIRILDSNTTISKYWWKDFLCCEQLISSEVNTKRAFSEIDRVLKKEIFPKSKPDYNYLRNNIITYFRCNQSLAYDDFLKSVIDSYVPLNSDVDVKGFSEKLKKLPNDKKFDTQFDIDKGSINARIKRVVVLAENFELNIKGEVKDLDRLVDTGTDAGGKYLKIYSDEGYYEFHNVKANGQ